ncbi:hypothetical protein FB451DRAFT_1176779 [Mycena latifolia]|nr:hypothetical protein FB451DRAFT_1176779 [Mycena latifolia]
MSNISLSFLHLPVVLSLPAFKPFHDATRCPSQAASPPSSTCDTDVFSSNLSPCSTVLTIIFRTARAHIPDRPSCYGEVFLDPVYCEATRAPVAKSGRRVCDALGTRSSVAVVF